MDAYTEFGIDMAYGYFRVSSSHYVRIYPNTNRNVRMLATKLLQDGKVVYVDPNAQFGRLLNFFQRDAVGGENDGLWFKTCQ